MPICPRCHTRYLLSTYWDPAEPCECADQPGRDRESSWPSQPSPEDREPTEDELWALRTLLDFLERAEQHERDLLEHGEMRDEGFDV